MINFPDRLALSRVPFLAKQKVSVCLRLFGTLFNSEKELICVLLFVTIHAFFKMLYGYLFKSTNSQSLRAKPTYISLQVMG